MRLGELTLRIVGDGGFRLDGGAMFGVVPKPLWERRMPADERNRIQLTTRCLLVERGQDLLLIDTGIGEKHDEKFRDIHAIEGPVRLPESIRAAGFDLRDVTHVLLTHLHFDHCGWNTRRDGERVVPTFPNARYWLCRGEVEHAREPSLRDAASYLPDNWEPLFEAGVVELFDEEAEPVPGVRAVKARGHNADMCIVLLEGGGEERAAFLADLVPTTAHLPYPWVMGYDLYPLDTVENKRRWLPRFAAERRLLIFEHDPDVPMARLVEERPGRFAAEPVTEETAAVAEVSVERA